MTVVDDEGRMRLMEAPVLRIGDMAERIMRSAEAEETRLASMVPSAFWLDDHEARPISVEAECAPTCPNACEAPVLVMANRDGRPDLWSCTLCGSDYDARGRARWRGSIARGRVRREVERRKQDRMRIVMTEELAR
jgi:hypothetical protein